MLTKNNYHSEVNLDDPSPKSNEETRHFHCSICVRSQCNYELCKLQKCNFCFVKLHPCKLEDHLSICLRAPTRCPNLIYGCKAKLRREHISEHLPHCPCSLVVCSCVWCRNYISEKAKQSLKLVAKGFITSQQLPSSEALDVKMALKDQALLKKFFQCSRVCRSRNCNGINAGSLKNTDFLDKFSESDSSEEEMKETARKLEKRKEPFRDAICVDVIQAANTYMSLATVY
uniref:TRAF-type domain-containing protein n=1 Tax=Ditylenchus dipsaci TaxID=166011 RepID=A0A915E3J1_9BILA